MSEAPNEVRALAEQRVQAKSAKDFTQADQLRAEIEKRGWQIKDTPAGFELTQMPRREVNLESKAELPITAEITVGLIVDGFLEDAKKCIRAIRQYSSDTAIVALVIGEGDLADFARENEVIDLYLSEDQGWGRAARWIVEVSPSPLQVLMDPSTIFEGDALSILKAQVRGEVVAAGWKGALVDLDDDWRSVIDRGAGEVDVLLGYLMMINRNSLLATDTPHAKAKFYRNADLELSLALRERGGKLVAIDLPVRQERHHGYHDSEPEFRDRESKRNYDRILARFRGHDEILSARR